MRTTHLRMVTAGLVGGLAASLTIPAAAATVHFSDFQSGVGSAWSSSSTTLGTASAPNPDYDGNRRFLGKLGNDTATLSLSGLPAHDSIRLSFELFTIRSWDGSDTSIVNGDYLGPDRWSVGFGGQPAFFSETFSNGNPAGQSYGGAFSAPASGCSPYSGDFSPYHAPMTGAAECYSLGYTFTYPDGDTEHMDSVYALAFDLAHSGESLTLNFAAEGLQGLADESWGLDNVRVSTVPLPGALWLLATGLLALIGYARSGQRR